MMCEMIENDKASDQNQDVLENSPHPTRSLHRLYCQYATFLCAVGGLPRPNEKKSSTKIQQQNFVEPSHFNEMETYPSCVPCAYKICAFDTCLDVDFTKQIPNQRPEQCPRFRSSLQTHGQYSISKDDGRTFHETIEHGTLGYYRGMKVLTVGDGDFTFSLAVSRLVLGCASSNLFGRHGLLVATSYENSDTLQNVYPEFNKTLNLLKCNGKSNVIIGYNVDATRLDETLPQQLRNKTSFNRNENIKFDRICWNFPCTAVECGQDGQNEAMEQNKDLCRKFVANALAYLSDDCGEIHMAHKTKPPYNQWLLEKVALEGIKQAKYEREFEFKGKIVFDRCSLPPYTPRKALDRKSFPCHDACVYVFGWRNKCSEDNDHPYSTVKDVPPIPPNEIASISNAVSPSSIIPVTVDMINLIRSLHMGEKIIDGSENANGKWNRQSQKRRKKR